MKPRSCSFLANMTFDGPDKLRPATATVEPHSRACCAEAFVVLAAHSSAQSLITTGVLVDVEAGVFSMQHFFASLCWR